MFQLESRDQGRVMPVDIFTLPYDDQVPNILSGT